MPDPLRELVLGCERADGRVEAERFDRNDRPLQPRLTETPPGQLVHFESGPGPEELPSGWPAETGMTNFGRRPRSEENHDAGFQKADWQVGWQAGALGSVSAVAEEEVSPKGLGRCP